MQIVTTCPQACDNTWPTNVAYIDENGDTQTIADCADMVTGSLNARDKCTCLEFMTDEQLFCIPSFTDVTLTQYKIDECTDICGSQLW